MKAAFRLELIRIVRSTPGWRGLVPLLLVPGALFVPWQRAGLFATTFEASLVLLVIYALLTASSFGDSGELKPIAFWLYQKGIPVAEYWFLRWIVALLIGMSVLAIGIAAANVAIAVYADWIPRQFVVTLAATTMFFLLSLGLYHVLGAVRLHRRTELVVLLIIIAFTQRLLFNNLPEVARAIAHGVLPPFEDPYRLASALVEQSAADIIPPFLHLSIYVAGCLAGAYFLHSRVVISSRHE